jgi:hypothetical protein
MVGFPTRDKGIVVLMIAFMDANGSDLNLSVKKNLTHDEIE